MDVEAARAGRITELLPEDYRRPLLARQYPLPSKHEELQTIALIPINREQCGGATYVRRAIKKVRERARLSGRAPIDAQKFRERLSGINFEYKEQLGKIKSDAVAAADEVKRVAQQAIASLTDLFALGRQGIEEQMRAYNECRPTKQGETITHSAFRDCFRMVTQAVKGLGLPSEQRTEATQAIMDEVAKAVESTRSAVALAPGTPDDTPQ